jgi:hypothetical protein
MLVADREQTLEAGRASVLGSLAVVGCAMPAKFEKPRPRPPKAEPAFNTLSVEEREVLAEGAKYVGSPHHTDVPKYGSPSNPRQGFVTIEEAGERDLKNPACMVCPRKWVRRQADATRVVREAIKSGIFISEGADQKPSKLWARDPDDPSIVYEAKLASPPDGYKAYPLTTFQVEFNLPFELP